MKNKITTLALIALMLSCKKEETATLTQPTETPITKTNQDALLMGTWSHDSLQFDGGEVLDYTGDNLPDIAIFTKELLIFKTYLFFGTPNETLWVDENEWETVGDSLFCSVDTIEVNRFQYSVTGNVLMLYLKSDISPDTKYWYSKN